MPLVQSNVNLAYANLAGQDLSGRDLSCCNLFRANLDGANLSNTRLSNANIGMATLRQAKLKKADLRNANLTGAILDGADLTDALLANANVFGTRLGSWDRPDDSASTSTSKKPGPSEVLTTDQTFDVGEYRYDLNAWGVSKLKAGETYSQSLLKRSVGAEHQYGWKWNWPDRVDRSVYAYPEIVFGWKPWGGANTTTKLPKQLKQLKSLTIAYDVDVIVATGEYNLAPEIWITNTDTAVDKNSIQAELMFWMDYDDDRLPLDADQYVGRNTLDGRSFDVYYNSKVQAEGIQWRLLSFKAVRKEPARSTLKVKAFLEYAVKGLQIVDPDHYLSSVEFGNEICSGSGETWINRYQVDVS